MQNVNNRLSLRIGYAARFPGRALGDVAIGPERRRISDDRLTLRASHTVRFFITGTSCKATFIARSRLSRGSEFLKSPCAFFGYRGSTRRVPIGASTCDSRVPTRQCGAARPGPQLSASCVFGSDTGSKSPRSRACLQAAKCEEYIPSRRSSAPSVPGAHVSASRKIRSFSSIVNRRLVGFSATSRFFLAGATPLGLVSKGFHHFPLPAYIRFRGTLVPTHLDTGGPAWREYVRCSLPHANLLERIVSRLEHTITFFPGFTWLNTEDIKNVRDGSQRRTWPSAAQHYSWQFPGSLRS